MKEDTCDIYMEKKDGQWIGTVHCPMQHDFCRDCVEAWVAAGSQDRHCRESLKCLKTLYLRQCGEDVGKQGYY